MSGSRRLDGWKAIAAHVGRDRSTVIRWAKTRGLPVHAVPGGSNRTVYALVGELDGWLLAPATAAVDPPLAAPIEDALPGGDKNAPGRRRLLTFAALAGVAVSGSLWWLGVRPPPRPPHPPDDPALVHAHDLIAERSAGSLVAATTLLGRLAAVRPDDARVHSAAAEAALLAREFGGNGDVAAFATARAEAATAIRIDPASAAAWRSIGFVRYWEDRQPVAAGDAFRRALTLAPTDPLAHLWYANALADAGENAAAAREMVAARTLAPGQPYALADAAWAAWSAGNGRAARASLTRLAHDHPGVASIEDCLSIVLLADGDLSGYAGHLRRRAADRGTPALIAYSALIDDAVARRDYDEVYRLILTRALGLADAMARPDHVFAAFVAATFGDRARVVSIVERALADGERWGSAGYRRRILARWPGDARLAAAVRRLAVPPPSR